MTCEPSAAAAQLQPLLIGTAGHVDHGKTALVQLLTGCRLDRQPEARRRGLTIDIDFAVCELPGARRVGIVDVPGHSDFIRNMVAGASSIDILLLVVAADDGIMAQTREHLHIVRHLAAGPVVVALNKCDLVEPARQAAVTEALRALLAAVGLPEAAIIPCSAHSGAGLAALRQELDALVAAQAGAAERHGPFRMSIDRVFTLPGHGTVATGVPRGAAIAPGTRLLVQPGGQALRLRSLQCFGVEAQATVSGTCNALLLRDAAPRDLHRGQVLCADSLRCSSACYALVSHLPDADPGRRREELRLHSGTAAVAARARLLDAATSQPGERHLLALRCEPPQALCCGDRVLLRRTNPSQSLYAATILGTALARPEPVRPELLARLWRAADVLAAGATAHAEALCAAEALVPATADRSGLLCWERWVCGPERRGTVVAALQRHCAAWHAAHPQSWGLAPRDLASALGINEAALAALLADCPEAAIVQRHGRYAHADWTPRLSAREQAHCARILAELAHHGLRSRSQLADACAVAPAAIEGLLRLLAADGSLVLCGKDCVDATTMARLRTLVTQHFTAHDELDLATFRQLSGLSRNRAIVVLDQLDAEGQTRRVGQVRVRAQGVT